MNWWEANDDEAAAALIRKDTRDERRRFGKPLKPGVTGGWAKLVSEGRRVVAQHQQAIERCKVLAASDDPTDLDELHDAVKIMNDLGSRCLQIKQELDRIGASGVLPPPPAEPPKRKIRVKPQD